MLTQVTKELEENRRAHEGTSHRHLCISLEVQIAINLEFLPATTDYSLRIMAGCVEECADGRGATIWIASNTGDLTVVTSEIKMLATILEQAARRG
jgi:hypothetical protein